MRPCRSTWPNRLLFQAVFLLPREHGSHCCGIITAVSQVEGHVVLSLDMFQLDAEIDMGIFKWRRKDEHQHVRVELQQRYLYLPRYWLLASRSLLTLG